MSFARAQLTLLFRARTSLLMKITKQFIFEHRTENGAWTYAQLEALGIAPIGCHGWIDRLDGTEISDEQVEAFIQGKYKFIKKGRVVSRLPSGAQQQFDLQ